MLNCSVVPNSKYSDIRDVSFAINQKYRTLPLVLLYFISTLRRNGEGGESENRGPLFVKPPRRGGKKTRRQRGRFGAVICAVITYRKIPPQIWRSTGEAFFSPFNWFALTCSALPACQA